MGALEPRADLACTVQEVLIFRRSSHMPRTAMERMTGGFELLYVDVAALSGGNTSRFQRTETGIKLSQCACNGNEAPPESEIWIFGLSRQSSGANHGFECGSIVRSSKAAASEVGCRLVFPGACIPCEFQVRVVKSIFQRWYLAFGLQAP